MQMHSARDILLLWRKKGMEVGTRKGQEAISITASRACLQEGRQFSEKIILLSSAEPYTDDPLQHEPLSQGTLHRSPAGETTARISFTTFFSPSFLFSLYSLWPVSFLCYKSLSSIHPLFPFLPRYKYILCDGIICARVVVYKRITYV